MNKTNENNNFNDDGLEPSRVNNVDSDEKDIHLDDSDIHITNSDRDEFDDLDGEKPRRNFVSGVPESEFEFERKTTVKKKGSANLTIALTAGAVVIIMAVVIFFITRGRGAQVAAEVKDNSSKYGVNSGSVLPQANFEDDYASRFGTNANTSPLMNPSASPGVPGSGETIGSGMTAMPPPSGSVGDLSQAGQPSLITPPSAAGAPNNNANNNGSTSGGSGSGGSRSSSAGGGQTESSPRIVPNRNTEIVDLPANRYQEQSSGGGGAASHNEQVSLFFYDPPSGAASGGRISPVEYERGSATPARPSFGTVLPIKILGRLHTLGSNALARMELTRSVQGEWGTLPRGTMFVGRVAGGQNDRLFVSLLGYIDPASNRLVTIGGDLQGRDGALGIEGDVKRGESRWKKVFGDLFGAAKQIGTAYLLGRSGGGGTVINNGALSQLPNSLDPGETAKFIVVPAGSQGYVVISELPPAIEADERLAQAGNQLSDDEILKMIQTGSPQEMQKLLPQLSPRAQQVARSAFGK